MANAQLYDCICALDVTHSGDELEWLFFLPSGAVILFKDPLWSFGFRVGGIYPPFPRVPEGGGGRLEKNEFF